MNGNSDKTDDEMNDTKQSSDSTDNPMNLSSLGKKRFFGRKADSSGDSHSKSIDGQTNSQSTKKSANKWSSMSSSNSSNQLSHSSATNGFKSAPNDLQNEDKFLGEGIQFNAKLIGHEFVAEARGEQMCQQSLKKLKILQRGLGGHKRKVHLFISFDGIKIRDANSSELLYHHSVPQISFISRDESDTRAFGYVFGSSTTGHQFIAFKTQKEAMPIMSAIGQLFAATLMRKRSEANNESLNTSVTTGAINEEKLRRESSATLRPSRSESPNVPSMPAPPVPTNTSTSSAPPAEEIDFFSAFEPMDSVFESDFKVNKEKLEQMPMTGSDPLSVDPFASSFGSLSLSSGDWANFDDESSANLQKSASNHSQNLSLTASTESKPFEISLPNSNEFHSKGQHLANSFNDSSSSMALKNLFSSFGQNVTNSSASMTPNATEAMAIPQRNADRNPTQNAPTNQSVGSTTSSADRYACFAEIHSINSSIFGSMVDQIAAETDAELSNSYKTSKSLNNSLNGGFGAGHQPQLSSSLKTPGNNFYYSFDNPLNSEQQKQNFLFANNFPNSPQSSQQMPQNANEFNAQSAWNNSQSFNNTSNVNSFTANPTNYQSNVWSPSSSLSGSQLSVASSPPPPSISAPTPPNQMTTAGFGINRSNDRLFDINPVFAELDPLGKDRPFMDKSQFFAEQKQKPTLKDLNSDCPTNNRSIGANSAPLFNQTAIQTNDAFNHTSNVSVVRSRPLSSNSNPFSDVVSNDSNSTSRLSPNPFNPFNSLNTSNPSPLPTPPSVPTPPLSCYTPPPPIPPPRPSSRECPPIPPRNDLNRESAKTPTESAPPLPRRRTILPEHRYQSFDAISKQSIDPFSPNPAISFVNNNSFPTTNVTNIKTTAEDFPFPAPPLPNPQRKMPSNPLPQPAVVPPQPMARKLSSSSASKASSTWDPFNCSFVDLQLSSIHSENMPQNQCQTTAPQFQNSSASGDNQSESVFANNSTPKLLPNTTEPKDFRNFSEDLKMSEIKYRYQSLSESVDKVSDSSGETPGADQSLFAGFASDFSQTSPFNDQKPTKPNLGLSLSASNSGNGLNFANFSEHKFITNTNNTNNTNNFNDNYNPSVVSSTDPREDQLNHISPPERNIFIPKSDPFADDFFAQ